jgi:hypothetical protein
MSTSVRALLAAARACVDEAGLADRRGERRYARELRQSARTALAEIRAITTPAPTDRETTARQERARAIAAAMLQALH